MMNVPKDQKHETSWQLESLPSSSAPEAKALQALVAQRRQRKRFTTAMLCTTVMMVLSGYLIVGISEKAVSPVEVSSRVADHPHLMTAEPLTGSVLNSATPKLKVYASIRQAEPVFRYDENRKTLVPVGWVHTRHSIPIDLDTFSIHQVESFQTILQNDTLQTRYEL